MLNTIPIPPKYRKFGDLLHAPILGAKGNVVGVEIATLYNSITAEHNIRSIDLMKMDVEGAEYDALMGAEKTLRMTRRFFLEIHSDELSRKCESLLHSKGFEKVFEAGTLQFFVNKSIPGHTP